MKRTPLKRPLFIAAVPHKPSPLICAVCWDQVHDPEIRKAWKDLGKNPADAYLVDHGEPK